MFGKVGILGRVHTHTLRAVGGPRLRRQWPYPLTQQHCLRKRRRTHNSLKKTTVPEGIGIISVKFRVAGYHLMSEKLIGHAKTQTHLKLQNLMPSLMPIAAPTPSLRYLFKTPRQGWEIVIRGKHCCPRENKESLYKIEKWQNKHGDQIVSIVQVRSIPMPIRQGGRAWKPWQGGMHVCERWHAEDVVNNIQRWKLQFVKITCFYCGCLDFRFIGNLLLNFRTIVASCSFRMI